MNRFRAVAIGVALAAIMAAAALFYARGYPYLSSDDTSNAVVGARYIYETRGTQFQTPYFAYDEQPYYALTNIASEFPLHLILSQLFHLVGTENVLRVANLLMVALFVLAGLPIFLTLREALRSDALALFGVAAALFSHWYGISFWQGHFAQLLGYLVLPMVIYGLLRFERRREGIWLVLALALSGLLFFIHSLSFLVAFIVVVSYLAVRFILDEHRVRRRLAAAGFFLLFTSLTVFLLYLRSRDPAYYPLFTGNPTAVNFPDALFAVLAKPGALLVAAGAFLLLWSRQRVLLTWLLVTYLLSQGDKLHAVFLPFRFTEFHTLPLVAAFLAGFTGLARLTRSRPTATVAAALLVAVYVPFGYRAQLAVRACYVQYCAGLHPTAVPPEDVAAFEWIGRNTRPDDRFIAVPKFGVFLPAVAYRSFAFPLTANGQPNAAAVALSDPSTARRWEAARSIGATYVFWDAVFDKVGRTYEPYRSFSDHFDDPRYFRRVYDSGGARVYAVEPAS